VMWTEVEAVEADKYLAVWGWECCWWGKEGDAGWDWGGRGSAISRLWSLRPRQEV